VRPRLRFIEEEDYNARWSVLFRLEGIFGYVPQTTERFGTIESIKTEAERNDRPQ
jgi:hypothetical protein